MKKAFTLAIKSAFPVLFFAEFEIFINYSKNNIYLKLQIFNLTGGFMKILMFSSLFLLVVFSASFAQRINSEVENVGQNCEASYKALLTTANSAPPDPFAMHNGTRISDKSEWVCRRNEVKKDLEQYEIGPKPDPSTATVAATYSGTTLTVKVTTKDGSINLTSTVSGSGDCIAIGMNGNAGNISGCKHIPFSHDQVVTYDGGSNSHNTNDPFYKVYPDLKGKIGKYAAWSWGISRLIDGIALVKEQLGIDMSKIGIQGCSYAGKMALFGGAMDERVTLTVVQESGGGGVNAWRYSKAFTARTGVNIEKIDNTSTSWFLSSMRNLDPDKLPHDHHQLIAMIAPRATIILGNPDYEWLGDESGYKSTIAARKVWQAFGIPDYIGFDFAAGHTHCQASTSQATNVTAFVNRFLKGQNVNTKVEANKPNKTNFNLDTTISWTVPTLTGTYGPRGTSSPSGSSSSVQGGSSSSGSAISVTCNVNNLAPSYAAGSNVPRPNVNCSVGEPGTAKFSISGTAIDGWDSPGGTHQLYNPGTRAVTLGSVRCSSTEITLNPTISCGSFEIAAEVTPITLNVGLTHFSLRALGKSLLIKANSPAVVDIYDLKGNKTASFNVLGISQIVNLSLPNGVYFAKTQGMQNNIMFVVR